MCLYACVFVGRLNSSIHSLSVWFPREKWRKPGNRLDSIPVPREILRGYAFRPIPITFFFIFTHFPILLFSFSFPFQATEIGSFTRRFPCEINDSECNMPSFLTLLCCHCHNLVTAVNGLFTIQSRVSLLDGEREAVLHKGSLFNNNNTTTTTTAVGRVLTSSWFTFWRLVWAAGIALVVY